MKPIDEPALRDLVSKSWNAVGRVPGFPLKPSRRTYFGSIWFMAIIGLAKFAMYLLALGYFLLVFGAQLVLALVVTTPWLILIGVRKFRAR